MQMRFCRDGEAFIYRSERIGGGKKICKMGCCLYIKEGRESDLALFSFLSYVCMNEGGEVF